MDEIEYQCRKSLVPFIIDCFKKFLSNTSIFKRFFSVLSELDVLSSMSILSEKMKVKCKPEFKKEQHFKLKEMTHPCVQLTGVDFVRNSVEFANGIKTMLITGPNMGGKSTLLRQSCIAIIMAQMGSFVPAESFELSVFDRIFSRIGASDKILEGKSTFYIEMEETLNILKEATSNSFAILDELGRGTSTYDGVAIAYSVLNNLIKEIQCFSMFSTHYKHIVSEFILHKSIDCYFMKYIEHQNEIEFLYKLSKGTSPHSFGVNVAKLAGLPVRNLYITSDKNCRKSSKYFKVP